MKYSQKTNWNAYYYEGKTAEKEIVTVFLESKGLKILKKDGGGEWWPYQDVAHTQGFHFGDPIHLEYELERYKSLVINDSNFIKALKLYAPEFAKDFSLPITKTKLFWTTVYSVIGLSILIPILYLWALPKFSGFTADNIPVSWEEELGEAYVQILAPDEDLCKNSLLHNKIEEILYTLTSTVPDSKYQYKLLVIDDSTVNAYALPGGYVLIYRGLIEKMNSPDEIAGVLAHEIQHVEQKHGMKSMVHQLSFKVIVAMMIGDSEGVSQFLDAAGMLGTLGYGRDAERDADRSGMEMLHNAKIDPNGMIDFFKTIEKEYGDIPGSLEYLSTHPKTEDRITYLEKLAQKQYYEPITLINDTEWDSLKLSCRK